MNESGLDVLVTADGPSNRADWDALAEANGNLLQSTAFDAVQDHYRMRPVYFEARSRGRLAGGVKLYRWEARRARAVTRLFSLSLTQFGELLGPRRGEAVVSEVVDALQAALKAYLRQYPVVSMRISGFYGGRTLLLAPGSRADWRREYRVAWIDLGRPLEAVWESFHEKHRAEIRKAERLGVQVVRDDDLGAFLELLAESYRDQERTGPSPEYVRHAYQTLRAAGRAMLFFAQHDGQRLAGAMLHTYGDRGSYDFAGLRRNRVGAGHFLQWSIMRACQDAGVRRYTLGQVAAPNTSVDPRFEGISRFKRRFGPLEEESYAAVYSVRPRRFALWSLATRWMT